MIPRSSTRELVPLEIRYHDHLPAQSTQLPALERRGTSGRAAATSSQEMRRPIDLYTDILAFPQHSHIDTVPLLRNKLLLHISNQLGQHRIELQIPTGSSERHGRHRSSSCEAEGKAAQAARRCFAKAPADAAGKGFQH